MIGGIAGTLSLRGDVPRRVMVALVNKITLSTEINVMLGLYHEYDVYICNLEFITHNEIELVIFFIAIGSIIITKPLI